jgi:hypothetical protein
MNMLPGFAALILALSLAGPALADHGGDASGAGEEERGANLDIHTAEVTGRVVEIDHEQGALMLQTARGLLALQGPPEALQDVKVGDLVRVRVALRDEPRLPPLPEQLGIDEVTR